jgi:hypothetical protein
MLSLSPTAASASAAPTFLGPIGAFEESPWTQIVRDDGIAVALPNGYDLWIFGDTATLQLQTKTVKTKVTQYVWVGSGKKAHWEAKQVEVPQTVQVAKQTEFVTGSTAAEVPYWPGQVPTTGTNSALEELQVGHGLNAYAEPSRFVPPPITYLPDGSGQRCVAKGQQYAARWVTGAAVMPDNPSRVLITYMDMCVQGDWKFQTEGWGFEEYDWTTNKIALKPYDVYPPSVNGSAMPPTLAMWSPVFSGGNLTLFSSICTSSSWGWCWSGQVYATAVPTSTAALENLYAYSPQPISTDGSAPWAPMSSGISVASYPGGVLRLVEQTSVAGTFNVFKATSAQGPWHLETSGTLPDCQGGNGFCYSIEAHPELSTPSRLFVSYYDPNYQWMPAGGYGGHLVMASVPI